MGAAKGKQSDTEALCQPLPPSSAPMRVCLPLPSDLNKPVLPGASLCLVPLLASLRDNVQSVVLVICRPFLSPGGIWGCWILFLAVHFTGQSCGPPAKVRPTELSTFVQGAVVTGAGGAGLIRGRISVSRILCESFVRNLFDFQGLHGYTRGCLLTCQRIWLRGGGGDLVPEETCLEKFSTPNSGAIFLILFFGHQVQNLYPVLGGGG